MKSYSNDLPNDTSGYRKIVIGLLLANLLIGILNLFF